MAADVEKYQLGTARIAGRERVVVHVRGCHLDLGALIAAAAGRLPPDLTRPAPPGRGRLTLLAMLERWTWWHERLPGIIEYAFAQGEQGRPLAEIAPGALAWLPPLLYPRKLICIGTNYSDHVAEMSARLGGALPSTPDKPAFPYSFLKPPTTTLVGDGATIQLPRYAELVDWEAELAVVIGARAHGTRGEAALAAVAGYSVCNDVSVRDWVSKPAPVGIDWVMAKAFDASMPLGPYITPAEFVPDPQGLRIVLTVNGAVKQDSNTAHMIHGMREIVEHLAAVMTLEPGDVIATGTPAGVGFARQPPERLQPGDTMVAEIEGLGRLVTHVTA
jgi:2-keto-4-pentenoate hydratase/2-oxohepta-3-ene-1,7-dioic acid hydratase in catechol pathway